ncbi:MAG: hypothetical protein KDB27_18400 [Planctomycetales bacterium]|nr:hypothetical protein [Planctomycetales bacterium]
MTLRLREKLPTTVQRILLKAASKFILPASQRRTIGKATLVTGLILLQPIVPIAASAQEKTRRTGMSLRRVDQRSTTAKKLTETHMQTSSDAWTTPRTLTDSDDQLRWNSPKHTGLESFHNKQPSFITPPKDMKRAELPPELANPGSVARAKYVEPTSGNHVVTTNNTAARPQKQANQPKQANDFRIEIDPLPLVMEAAHHEIAPLELVSPRSNRPTSRSPNRQNARVALLQDDVFNDEDLGGSPQSIDLDDFSGDDLGSATDLGFGDERSEAGNAIPEEESAEAFTGDDAFSDIRDDNATTDSDDNSGADLGFDDAADSDDGNIGAESFPDDVADELVPPADDSTIDPGPFRRPEAADSATNGRRLPSDLSATNRRDCPQEQGAHETAMNTFLSRSIKAISLDITPEYEPNQPADINAERRDAALAKTEARQWRDRTGAVVAEGLFRDFEHGRVHVETSDGTIKKLQFHDLSSSDMCFVSAWWGIPTEYQINVGQHEVRNWTTQTFTWKASGACHKPLYFEEVQLERYGHSAGPMKQTMLSGVHFFGNILFLPYKMGVNPPNECQYTLGYYRPGDCAPWLLHAIPLSARGARLQTAAVLGGIGLVP